MSRLSGEAVLEKFDRLQRDGELFYAPTEPVKEISEGLEFEFRIVPSFTSKPQLSKEDSTADTAQSAHRPPPSDGSDIDHADPAFFVGYVSPSGNVSTNVDSPLNDSSHNDNFTHKLILNKFCVFRPQYLLLTTDPLQRQTSALNEGDLRAAWNVVKQFASSAPHYLLFNCGRDGGSSRMHKHMQVFEVPKKGEGRSLLWPHTSNSIGRGNDKYEALPLPFMTFYSSLGGATVDEIGIIEAYKIQYAQCCAVLGKDPLEDVPHNVVLTTEWLITVPRRAASTNEGHIVNAAGMLGLVWCGNKDQLDGWRERGPTDVLRVLGVPPS